MTREEQLEFCKKCGNRKYELQQGIICGLTNAKADFEEHCFNYQFDAQAQESIPENHEISNEAIVEGLYQNEAQKLRLHQDFNFAIIGGVLAMLVSALLWATITLAINFQIGYMAMGVGLIVGFAIQFFGAGIDKKFGYLGGALSLVGCILGNFLFNVFFISNEYSLGFLEVLYLLDTEIAFEIMFGSFHIMDVVFYGLAMYAGYHFAFRKLTNELVAQLSDDNFEAHPPFHNLRKPLAAASIVAISLLILFINSGEDGMKTFTYDSGEIMSQGEMIKGKEHGEWRYYHENGNLHSIGYFNKGNMDGTWQWFNDDGVILRESEYFNGIEQGRWITYHNNGVISDSVAYLNGRMQGEWISKFEDGSIFQKGFMNRNLKDSLWQAFHPNGQLNTEGFYRNGDAIGEWKTYYENGKLAEVIEFLPDGNSLIKLANAPDGKSLVVNGNGNYMSFSASGKVEMTGEIRNGMRTGYWKKFSPEGNVMEEGRYEDNEYKILNAWNLDRVQTVNEGMGTFMSFYTNSPSVFETGEIVNGLKNGNWKVYYEETGGVYQELNFKDGKLHGKQKFFYQSGNIYSEGNMVDDLRDGEWKWFYENGIISSSVKYFDNKKEGTQTMWSETGFKTKEEVYRNGELVSEKNFN